MENRKRIQTTYSWLSSRISRETKIHLVQNLTGKKGATTWTETPLSCECAPWGKELGGFLSPGKADCKLSKSRNFLLRFLKKCVNISNMLNLLSKRKCFIESLTSSTRQERAAGLHNNIIILPSKKQGGHYSCNLKKKLQ